MEVYNFQGYDVIRGSEFLGQSYMANSVFRINTTNSRIKWSGWPWPSPEYYYETHPIKGDSSHHAF